MPWRSASIAGLVIGKLVGVFGSTYLVARFTRARLDDDLAWRDVGGLAMLTGVGFTVSLLVGELAFGVGSARDDSVKLAVLVGSLLSALLASVAAADAQPRSTGASPSWSRATTTPTASPTSTSVRPPSS